MSERRRNALLVLLLVAFAVLAVAINSVLGENVGQSASSKRAAVERGDIEPAPSAPGVIEGSDSQRARKRRGRDDAREVPSAREVPPPERRIEERDRDVLGGAGPVARRFLDAFTRYEVGRLDSKTRAELRATATAAFFPELVSAPPRVPTGAKPPRARPAARFEVVPIAAAPSGDELLEVELVTSLVRASERTPIGIRLRRVQGRWRVSGLTR